VEALIVEDVTAARQAEQLLLEGAGAQVRSATCAALAVEAFAARRPDVIVADIGMPDEDGYSMMKRLRQVEQEQRTKRVPAIAVTAFARAEDRQRALAAGFDDHLPKPINPDLLITTIARLTRSARENSASES
jgi:CheY-like chemotaxis protein